MKYLPLLLLTLLLAGHETTATALAWTLEQLLRNPASLAALLDEAVRFVGSGATISVADGDLPSARKWVESTSLECTATGEAASRGSVTATSSDGKRRADNGLDSRLRRVKETGSAAISRVLFAAR